MSPVTHFLLGWLVANTSEELDRKERTVITAAAIAPDVDGLGLVVDWLTRNSEHPTNLYMDYHHTLAHNLGFCLFVAFVGFLLAKRRWKTAALALLSVHLHLLCDLVGSRSPDGSQWAIPYLMPFSSSWQLAWSGQWELNAWQNFAITIVALILTFVIAVKYERSPLEMVSGSADRAVVETFQRRFRRGK